VVITKIEKQKKDKKRYNIFLDDEFFCGLYEDTILKFGLASKDEISEAKMEEIRDFDEYIFGKKIAFDSLAYRIRTVAEIRQKLRAKKVSEPGIEKVLTHLAELGLTSDEEFARQLANEKIKRKGIGRKLIMQKFFEKGISKSTGEEVLEKIFSEVDEKQIALDNFRKYYPKIKQKDIGERKRKTFDHLARKGFDFEVINEIIRDNIY
jgi:regulatory protein